MREHILRIVVALVFFSSFRVYADKKGEGGVALEDTPIYLRSDALEAASSLKKGQPVAAIRSIGLSFIGHGQYIFDEKNGRAQVYYFPAGEDQTRGKFYSGWVDPAKLAKFYYDCSCGREKDDCDPLETRGLRFSFTWNSCFKEAWERKMGDMAAAKPADNQVSAAKESVEDRLKKLDEIFKKGLISKEEYDKKRAEIISSF